MSFSNRSRFSIVALSLAALVSCGGSSQSDTTNTIAPDVDLLVSAVPAIRWDATSYQAPAGELKIAMSNMDSVKHVLVILEGDTVVGDLELVVNKKGDYDDGVITLLPGEYRIYCTIPGHGGMNSTLTVS